MPVGKDSFNEVRSEVMKTEDEGSGKKPPTSRLESLGNEREKKRIRRYSECPFSYAKISNRMDKTLREVVASWAPKRCRKLKLCPLKSSRWILSSDTTSFVPVSSETPVNHVKKMGEPFERSRNRGHALEAPATHQTRSRGYLMATSFQGLHT